MLSGVKRLLITFTRPWEDGEAWQRSNSGPFLCQKGDTFFQSPSFSAPFFCHLVVARNWCSKDGRVLWVRARGPGHLTACMALGRRLSAPVWKVGL